MTTLALINAHEAVSLLAPLLAPSSISVRVEKENEVWWWRREGCRLDRITAEQEVNERWNVCAANLKQQGKSMPGAPSPYRDANAEVLPARTIAARLKGPAAAQGVRIYAEGRQVWWCRLPGCPVSVERAEVTVGRMFDALKNTAAADGRRFAVVELTPNANGDLASNAELGFEDD